ncbi:hypothetical protein [Legionella cardiaca]|uniref:Ankyrin repeat protein n=1 Tax=Legionella cardiaca TaxID=1071983 RepID=A0ABY8ATL5_9GAMM|nr:hypothetical protein [Legionella cardiaca]WED42850.1 hypothetical protein PXX05_13245 [Legionella cardiaca]
MPDISAIKNFLLLAEKDPLIDQYEAMPLYCSNIKAYVTAMEFFKEVRLLKKLLDENEQDFAERFKAHCFERAGNNADSCLSFTTNHWGVCNSFYQQLVELVFKEQSSGEKLSILMPQVTTVIELDSYFEEGVKPRSANVKMRFNEHAIADLNSTVELQDVVIYKSYLFDVKQIAKLDFNLHRTFYRALKQNYPDLVPGLYQHNADLRLLHRQLELIDDLGQTPEEAISSLIGSLLRGGESVTKQVYATNGAHLAFEQFQSYLEALPSEFRKNLLALSDVEGYETLAKILMDLHEGHCVENASYDLNNILGNPANKTLLKSFPYLSSEEKQNLEAHYKKKHLITAQDNAVNSDFLPAYYLKQILPFIEINRTRDFIALLSVTPPSLYAFLLQHTTINLEPPLSIKLALSIRGGLLNGQESAFYQAILANREKCGDLFYLLQFAIFISGSDLFRGLFESVPAEDRFILLNEIENVDGLVAVPELVEIVMQQLPQDNHFRAITTKSIVTGKTLFHNAVYNQESLKIVLANLAEEELLEAVNTRDNFGNTVLHQAIHSPPALQAILLALPEEERFAAIKEKNLDGFNLLSQISHNPNAVQSVLNVLSKDEFTEKKLKLFIILEKITANIERYNFGCWMTGLGSYKVKLLRELQDQLLEDNQEYNDISFFLESAFKICQIKRNPLHFWATPKSVNEFLDLIAEENLSLPERKPDVSCFNLG